MRRTGPTRKTPNVALIVVAAIIATGSAAAQDDAPRSCTDCHKNSFMLLENGSFGDLLAGSVHKGLKCAHCHQSISMDEIDAGSPKPHGDAVEPVACGECHDDAAESYTKHGRLEVGTNPDIPQCWNCHGAHNILPSADERSSVNPQNLPATCDRCHTDVNLIKNHQVLRDEPIKLYKASVHAAEKGAGLRATCVDCHSAVDDGGHLTGHRILSVSDPDGPVYHSNIPNMCGRCHAREMKDYWEGVHGQRVRAGDLDAPVCTRCHGEHGILASSDVQSSVSAARLAVATCAPCHDSEMLNERYGGWDPSFIDTYHGLKKKAGNVHVANCASCHGNHRILPQADPRSSINAGNLRSTCGRCHPGISSTLAGTTIHGKPAGTADGWPHWVKSFYIWLIVGTIGLMLLHNIAHWFRHVRSSLTATQVVRFTVGETAQHWILMLSFIVLVLSGFSLRFSEAWWVRILFGWGGGAGFVIRGTLHRVAAVVLVAGATWHVLYLCTRRGRRWLRDMAVSKRDFTHLKQNTLFFLGRSKSPPRFGRFGYVEKSEYWALVWGTAIMALTGVLLWFKNYFILDWSFNKVVLDLAQVIHYYEAWLATLAIVVWHIYGTVFSPAVYPMNPSWLAGKMPQAMHDEEHPEEPQPPTHA